MKLKRTVYLGYYLKQLNRQKFWHFLNYAAKQSGRSKAILIADAVQSVFRYNISLLEYFQFKFYELKSREREDWAGTGFMYEHQLRMNPPGARNILENKISFYKKYKDFFIHQLADINDLKNDALLAFSMLSNPTGKLVFKTAEGNCGTKVDMRSCEVFDREGLIKFLEYSEYDLVEECIEQHPALNRLSPSAVNTVRVITEIKDDGKVEILGCRLRISINLSVDNMAAGNIAASIDEESGKINGPAVYSDITNEQKKYHPITGERIIGFQIPFWERTLEMVKKAAGLYSGNRSIGWDIVITKSGPGLIEGNHDWCKLLWQLPVEKGLKGMLID